jgi:hypothetical protein
VRVGSQRSPGLQFFGMDLILQHGSQAAADFMIASGHRRRRGIR